MDTVTVLLYIIVFLFGITAGSFLNVVIIRMPKKESIVAVSSHCVSCGRKLRWFELIPLISYIFLRGKCRTCKTRIPAQYPLIEAGNGLLWVIVFAVFGFTPYALLCCFLTSALLALSVIDGRTGEIPIGINIFILVLGICRLLLDTGGWPAYAAGFFTISLPLYIILLLTRGRGIGGGDIKLMAACGLFLGWKLILLAFFAGCVIGAVIHIIRMKIAGAGRALALGPYLSAGIFFSMLWGEKLVEWYLGLL
jgi:leader peptidase (prepilin peptidase)/N-methyltransferase